MNERIKELLIEAGFKIFGNKVVAADNSISGDATSCSKKFANLIVRECMAEAWGEIVSDEDIALEEDPLIREYLKGNNQGIVDAVIRFRNHFGVEE